MAHLEPRLPYVPSFLVNFILKVASPIVLGAVQKVGRSSPSPCLRCRHAHDLRILLRQRWASLRNCSSACYCSACRGAAVISRLVRRQ